MRWNAFIFALLLGGAWLFLAAVRTASAEPKTYEYGGGGKWTRAQTQPSSSQPVVDAVLDDVERMLAAGQAKEAKDRVVEWLKANPSALDRDRGIFLLADVDYRLEDRIKAFYQLDELLDKYPDSRLFSAALHRQYEIADGFLNGAKLKLLGLRILGAEDEAVDMMFRIQERSPGSPLAEKCLLGTADYYFNSSQFDLASDAYAAFVRTYSRSAEAPRARLRRAFSSYAQFHGVKFDSTPLIDARAQFEDIKARYPDLAAENNVQKFIDGINETLARKLFVSADFYRRTGEPRAAVYTFRQLISTYPASKEAGMAKGELDKIPESLLREPILNPARPAEPPTTGPRSPRPASELRPGPLGPPNPK